MRDPPLTNSTTMHSRLVCQDRHLRLNVQPFCPVWQNCSNFWTNDAVLWLFALFRTVWAWWRRKHRWGRSPLIHNSITTLFVGSPQWNMWLYSVFCTLNPVFCTVWTLYSGQDLLEHAAVLCTPIPVFCTLYCLYPVLCTLYSGQDPVEHEAVLRGLAAGSDGRRMQEQLGHLPHKPTGRGCSRHQIGCPLIYRFSLFILLVFL